MFGEYGVYVDGKMIGLICDDQLYVKPTPSGRRHAEPVTDAPPYTGAKPHLLIEADRWTMRRGSVNCCAYSGGTADAETSKAEEGRVSDHSWRPIGISGDDSGRESAR